MGDKPVLFDAYLQEDLAQQSDEYKKEFHKEVYMLKIACKVMNFRKELGLTQREFAQKTGVAQSTIADIENGNVDPRLSTLVKLGVNTGFAPDISYTENKKEVTFA